MTSTLASRLSLAAALWVAACAKPGPRPIALGVDACAYCRMTISDSRFGGEVVTSTGRVLTFDSIECLADWARGNQLAQPRTLHVIDLQHPGSFVGVDSAAFLRATMIASPMGRSLVAFASPRAATEQQAMLGGRVMRWAEVLADSARPGRGS